MRKKPGGLVPSLVHLLWLIVLLALVPPVLSDGVIYKYVDDNGVPTFTEQWQSIPERYHGRVQVLDPVTLQPVQASRDTATPRASTSSPVESASRPEPAQPPAAPSWLDRLSQVTITLPSHYQTGVGLTTLVLVAGMIMVMRFSSNPLVKVLGKLAIMLMIGGAVYAIYFSGLNDRISEATRQPTHRITSGKEILGEVKGTAAQVTNMLEKTVAPVTSVIDKTKAATIGEVNQTVTQANQSNQELQQRLGEIDRTATR
jgi:hypothetical protein